MADEIKKKSVEETLLEKNMGSLPDNLDRISAGTIGAMSTMMGDNLRGINHRQTAPPLQTNKDYYGLTFFTRPLMNFSTENLRAERIFAPLLTKDPATIARYIRGQLDPRLTSTGYQACPFVDDQQAFIPLLTNNLISMGGWPDLVLDSHVSPQGAYKEVVGFIDDVAVIYSTYDITANFRNLPGDPITAMMQYWDNYSSLVHEGAIMPYPEYVMEHEIDYMTRIYRLVLDSTKTRVTKIAACGASYPTNAPLGAAFNFEATEPINSSNDQISIQFKAYGAMYNDPILIYEFNRTVQYFNDGMADGIRENLYKLVPIKALRIFNNKGYARINPDNYNLEWWVSNEEYAAALSQVTAIPDVRVAT